MLYLETIKAILLLIKQTCFEVISLSLDLFWKQFYVYLVNYVFALLVSWKVRNTCIVILHDCGHTRIKVQCHKSSPVMGVSLSFLLSSFKKFRVASLWSRQNSLWFPCVFSVSKSITYFLPLPTESYTNNNFKHQLQIQWTTSFHYQVVPNLKSASKDCR